MDIGKIKKVIGLKVGYVFVASFLQIFLNLWVWSMAGDMKDMIYLNMIVLGVWVFSYHWGTHLLTTIGFKKTLGFSFIWAMASFSYLTWVPSEGHFVVWLTGLAIGLGIYQGLFSSGYNLCVNRMLTKEELTEFYEREPIYVRSVFIFTPFLTAWIIHEFGYEVWFLMMVVSILVLMGFTSRVEDFKEEKSVKEERREKKSKHWFGFMQSMVWSGFFKQSNALLLLVFTFTLTENVWLVALLNVTYTCVGLGLRAWKKRWVSMSENGWLYGGMGFVWVSLTVYIVSDVFWLHIGAALMLSVGMYMYESVYVGRSFQWIKKNENDRDDFLWRERMMAGSRSVLLAFLWIVVWLGIDMYGLVLVVSIISGIWMVKTLSKAEEDLDVTTSNRNRERSA